MSGHICFIDDSTCADCGGAPAPVAVRVECDRCEAAVLVGADYIASTGAEVVDGVTWLRCSAWPRAWHFAKASA